LGFVQAVALPQLRQGPRGPMQNRNGPDAMATRCSKSACRARARDFASVMQRSRRSSEWRAGHAARAFLRQRPIFNLSQVHVVIAVLQIEGAYEAKLMGGKLAQRLGLDANLLAMSEIAESLLKQWCKTISRDRKSGDGIMLEVLMLPNVEFEHRSDPGVGRGPIRKKIGIPSSGARLNAAPDWKREVADQDEHQRAYILL
jgi:hypothetical protein